ncbi:Peptidoglycan/LPS O-acetylase OafA/YrhL, contains acyltransferase and SGNH-hydrolase domains [Lachnospiraceae bacterium YSD2013]|nr:Peptidoglycan/LPS O-acetylase OafA/YrhL, contains acyltransferase and SGNH-hydrolase domains [Lachnospiraceae bacterium YSD2013]
MDLIKGLCIIFVVVTHCGWDESERRFLLFPYWIEMAVPIFMVITGYNISGSFERKEYTLHKCYSPSRIVGSFLRFFIPFLPAWIFTVMVRIIEKGMCFSIYQLIKDFLSGGAGPGSYYFPVMIQVIVIFPLMWFTIKKKPLAGLILFFVLNVSFEIVKTVCGMSVRYYRLCSFRYLFVLAYGCYLYFIGARENKPRIGTWFVHVIIGLVGAVYIFFFYYLGFTPLFTNLWTVTSVFATLLIVPILRFLFGEDKITSRVIEEIGKASYNIFCVQMVFFMKGDAIVSSMIKNKYVGFGVIIIVCCLIGYLYYLIETPITKRMCSRIERMLGCVNLSKQTGGD